MNCEEGIQMSETFVKLHGIELKLSYHLRYGGDLTDNLGKHIVSEFINEFLSIPSKHSIGNAIIEIQTIIKIRNKDYFDLSIKDLEEILTESILATYPNVWVKYYDSDIVSGTILFFEPIRLYSIQTELKRSELKITSEFNSGNDLLN